MEIYEATEGKVPIIGTGGVFTVEDAIELMLAGASLVGIGTALADRGAELFGEIARGMETWCNSEGVKHVSELIGAMHKELIKRGMKGTSMKHS